MQSMRDILGWRSLTFASLLQRPVPASPDEASPIGPAVSVKVLSRWEALRCSQGLGIALPVNDWATILPSRTTNVSVPNSYTLSAVSAVHRM